jgi:tetratricopeptide (TPR) repeat protein
MKTILTAKSALVILLGVVLLLPLMSGCSKPQKPVVQESQVLLSGGKYEEAIAMLEQAYKAGEGADSVKSVLTNAHLLYGNFLMYKSSLPQSQKYGKALTEFKRVLTLDSANQEAKKNKEIVEGILSQEGAQVPK